MSSLTEEQRKRIEENRLRALNKLKASGLNIPNNSPSMNNSSNNSGANRNIFSPSFNNSYKNGAAAFNNVSPHKVKPVGVQARESGHGNSSNDHRNPSSWFPNGNSAANNSSGNTASNRNLFSSPKPNNSNSATHTVLPVGISATNFGDKSSSSNHVVKPVGISAPPFGSSNHKNPSNWFSSTSASSSISSPSKPISGICWLSDVDRFSVKIAYHSELINAFKTIPGRNYDIKNIIWSFPLSEYENFRRTVDQFKPNVTIGAIPKYVLDTFKKPRCKKYQEMNIDLSPIEPKLMESLYPFQKEGVMFGISKSGRCIIADDMGLGKTIQALGIADYYRSDWPLLIVSPSSMRYQWEQEIITHLPKVSTVTIHVITSSKDEVINPQVVIISYDLMARMEATLLSFKFGVIIMDESHLLKTAKSARAKSGLKLLSKARRCILLSGTPALSRPMELYNQLRAISPNWVSMKDFGVRYCDGKMGRFGWDFSGCSNMEELKILLEEKFLIRRLKSDVLTQLPAKMRKVVLLSTEQVKKDSATMNALSQKLSNDDLRGTEKRSCLLTYYSETGKCKIKAICNYVSDLLEIGSKFLIFAHHTEVLDAISNLLEEKKTYYIRIDGRVSSDERKDVCDQFQFEDRFQVAVLSITAASTGITLTAASLVVFAELFWNPGILTQAEDRAHRIGQENSVVVQYLVAKGTADDYLWPLVEKKLNILNQAGLSKDTFSTAATTAMNASSANLQTTMIDYFEELDGEDENDALLSSTLDALENSEIPEKRAKLM